MRYPMAIFASLALLAAAGFGHSSEAIAVDSAQAVGLRPYFAPRIRFVDTPMIAEELGLEDERRVILEQIVLDYQQFVDQTSRSLLEQIQEAEPFSVQQDPAAVQRDSLRKDLRRTIADYEPDRMEQAIRASMRSELSASEQSMPPASPRTKVIRAWRSMHDQQWAALVESVDAIRDPQEPEHWDAVFRALRRRNSPWRPMVSGETVDLARIVHDHWGRDSDCARHCYPALLAYAAEYDDSLRARDNVIEVTRPGRLDAEVVGAPGPWIEGARREAMARAGLASLNKRYIGVISSCMDLEDSSRFIRLANRAMYPEIYRPTSFERLHRHVQGRAETLGLSADQLRALEAFHRAYVSTLQPIRLELINSFMISEAAGIMLDAESAAMLRCYGYMGPLDPKREELAGRINMLMEQIDTLDEEAIDSLRRLVGSDVFARIPAAAYEPALVLTARSLVQEDPGELRVVYLKGAGDRSGIDGSEYDVGGR